VAAESKSTDGDNLNNVRCETCRTFRNKKKEYLKEKNELEANNKSTKGINEF
jgi:hypothetical protein